MPFYMWHFINTQTVMQMNTQTVMQMRYIPVHFSPVSQVRWVVFFIFIFPACISGQLQGSGLLSYTLKT
jgi:hypothetical protein